MVETPEREGGASAEPKVEDPSVTRMVVSCLAAAVIGLTVPISQHFHVTGPMAAALFWLWFLGPVVAGAILRRPGPIPYLVPAVVWYGVLLAAMALGWMAPVSAKTSSSFDPLAAVVYLIGALPFVTVLAAAASFVAGQVARWVATKAR